MFAAEMTAAEPETLLDLLPREILVLMLSYLPTVDLQRASLACSALEDAADEASLWQRIDISRGSSGGVVKDADDLLGQVLTGPCGRSHQVETINAFGCKTFTGSCLSTAFGGAGAPLLSELDLSYCTSLQLPHLVRCLRYVGSSLTMLSLRNLDHLLNDRALDQLLSALAESAQMAPQPPTRATRLTALNLGTSTRRGARQSSAELTDETLVRLVERAPALASLSLHNQECITDGGVTTLAQGCPRLTALDVGLCSSLTDSAVASVATYLPTLRALNLRSCWRVTSDAVRCLLDRCKDLEALNLFCCSFVGAEAFLPHSASSGVEPMATDDHDVMDHHVMLQGQPVVPAHAPLHHQHYPYYAAAGHQHNQYRRRPHHRRPNPSIPSTEPRSHPRRLKDLNLSYMRRLTGEDLLTIARLTGNTLLTVSLSKCDLLTNATLIQLCIRNPQLEALNVADCLKLDACWIDDLALAHLRGRSHPQPLKNLHALNVRQCRRWTDSTTAALLSHSGCGARSLRRLYLGGTSGSDGRETGAIETPYGDIMMPSAASGGGGWVNGQPFYVDPHELAGPTDQSIVLIADTLGCALEVLDVECCEGISDAGVHRLAIKCLRMRKLVLSGLPRITDTSLHHLASNSVHLTELYVSFCPHLTSQSIYQLRKKRPDIQRILCRREAHLRGPPPVGC